MFLLNAVLRNLPSNFSGTASEFALSNENPNENSISQDTFDGDSTVVPMCRWSVGYYQVGSLHCRLYTVDSTESVEEL